MIIAQYLEPGPDTPALDLADVRQCLRSALQILPIDAIAVGWNLTPQLLDACATEAMRAGAHLYRWQPLLTDDNALAPLPAWQTIGLAGVPVPGFQGMPEFTFICPNQPAARAAVLGRVRELIRDGYYQGLFLDRIRFPSPADTPLSSLACFCDACQDWAAIQQVDLQAIQQILAATARDPSRAADLATGLLAQRSTALERPEARAITTLLELRTASITTLITEVAALCHAEGLAVGLDCFSPRLARMVGQDLAALAPHADWIKVMSYGHTLGPAGIPFELVGLARWLVASAGMSEQVALTHLGAAANLRLPATLTDLQSQGIASADLASEIQHGLAAGARPLLFGIELVDLPGMTSLTTPQIIADLQAARQAGAHGLVLSWDLWHISPARLATVRDTWFQPDT